MRLILILLTLPLIALLLNSCAEDALESTHTPEMYYVDLLYALHHDDQPGAKDAARQFTKSISGFHPGHYSMRSEEEIEDTRFYLDKAKKSYFEVRASITAGQLEPATVQLNQSIEALKAARIPGIEELYVASVHDFLSSWLEVSRISRKEGLSTRDWRALDQRIKATHTFWRQCKGIHPSPTLYYFSEEDAVEFSTAHKQVDRLMGELKASLAEENAELTKSYVDAADSAIWALIRRFGSPAEGGLKIIPSESDPSR